MYTDDDVHKILMRHTQETQETIQRIYQEIDRNTLEYARKVVEQVAREQGKTLSTQEYEESVQWACKCIQKEAQPIALSITELSL